jgi:hypothetical protein
MGRADYFLEILPNRESPHRGMVPGRGGPGGGGDFGPSPIGVQPILPAASTSLRPRRPKANGGRRTLYRTSGRPSAAASTIVGRAKHSLPRAHQPQQAGDLPDLPRPAAGRCDGPIVQAGGNLAER